MPCLNSPFVLMSAFEEFVSRTLYMHFYGEERGKGEKKISLPEAHHAASSSNVERNHVWRSFNQELKLTASLFLFIYLFFVLRVINHLKVFLSTLNYLFFHFVRFR